MRLGIVGHEAAKFTPQTEALAREAIRLALRDHNATAVVSGHCHLGGVDIWAEEAAAELGLPMVIYAPRILRWDGPDGFKTRNLRIANDSDLVVCVALTILPGTYMGMRFEGCYHCKGRNPPHVKSGGCWTAWKAKAREWRFV